MGSEDYDEDIVKNKFPVLIETLERFLDFRRWGFTLINVGALSETLPSVFYQSELCKIRFRWQHDRPYEEPIIEVNYGRIHAPLDQNTMIWHGERCYCWHSVERVLNFLDGLAPTDLDNKEFGVPHIIHDFYLSNKDKGWKPMEYTARKHAVMWEHYGQRLFDLFDLEHSSLWLEYARFLEDYERNRTERTRRRGRIPISSDPPLYKVC